MRTLLPWLTGLLSVASLAAQAETLNLTSSDFSNNSNLASKYTCHGENISPQLSWQGVSTQTKTLALIVSDPDATNGTFYHWVVYNIPNTLHSLPENIKDLPSGISIGKNSAGNMAYKGPCPPPGPKHRYIFTLYALDAPLVLNPTVDAETVLNAMRAHILASTSLTTTYQHP